MQKLITAKNAVLISVFFIILFLSYFLVTQSQKGSTATPKVESLRVSTSLYPIFDFARTIGGDRLNLTLVLPPGAEPHSFEPKPSDLRAIYESDVFFYTSDIMEPWVAKLESVGGPKKINLSESKGMKILGEEEVGHEDEDPGEVGHEHEGSDPHYWLDPTNAIVMVNEIVRSLTELDPSGGGYYEGRRSNLVTDLTKLDKELFSIAKSCENKHIYHAGHFAFGYFANRYGMTYGSISGYTPESDINAQDISDFINNIKSGQVKAIYFEELSDPKVAKVIARETGAKLLILNAAHNVSARDMEAGVSYIDIMRQNGANIAEGCAVSSL